MDDIDPARREHIRRWVRPDFERFLRPDWERYVTPAGRERRLRELAEYKAAFEPWQVRRLREQNEVHEREEEAALERKLAEFRRERLERERGVGGRVRGAQSQGGCRLGSLHGNAYALSGAAARCPEVQPGPAAR